MSIDELREREKFLDLQIDVARSRLKKYILESKDKLSTAEDSLAALKCSSVELDAYVQYKCAVFQAQCRERAESELEKLLSPSEALDMRRLVNGCRTAYIFKTLGSRIVPRYPAVMVNVNINNGSVSLVTDSIVSPLKRYDSVCDDNGDCDGADSEKKTGGDSGNTGGGDIRESILEKILEDKDEIRSESTGKHSTAESSEGRTDRKNREVDGQPKADNTVIRKGGSSSRKYRDVVKDCKQDTVCVANRTYYGSEYIGEYIWPIDLSVQRFPHLEKFFFRPFRILVSLEEAEKFVVCLKLEMLLTKVSSLVDMDIEVLRFLCSNEYAENHGYESVLQSSDREIVEKAEGATQVVCMLECFPVDRRLLILNFLLRVAPCFVFILPLEEYSSSPDYHLIDWAVEKRRSAGEA